MSKGHNKEMKCIDINGGEREKKQTRMIDCYRRNDLIIKNMMQKRRSSNKTEVTKQN